MFISRMKSRSQKCFQSFVNHLGTNFSQNFSPHKNIKFSTLNHSPKWEEFTIPVPYGVIAGKAWGDKRGIPLLGLHGWSDNAATHDRLASKLDKSIYLVSVDFPGHGLSSHLPPGVFYTYLDFLIAVRRVVKYLKWDKFSIIGHSMGAGIGALYSSVFFSEVEQLILLDLHKNIGVAEDEDESYADHLHTSITSFLGTEEKLRGKTPLYSYGDAIARLREGTMNSIDEDTAKILLARGAKQVEGNKWEYTRDLRLHNLRLQRYTNNDLLAMLANIRCRLLLLKAQGGTHFEDDEVFQRTITLYKERCTEFQYREIVGNHFFHLNNPEETAEHVNKFILGKDTNSASPST